MAYQSTEDCMSCGACEAERLNSAIKEVETAYVIDRTKCTECIGNFSTPNALRFARFVPLYPTPPIRKATNACQKTGTGYTTAKRRHPPDRL